MAERRSSVNRSPCGRRTSIRAAEATLLLAPVYPSLNSGFQAHYWRDESRALLAFNAEPTRRCASGGLSLAAGAFKYVHKFTVACGDLRDCLIARSFAVTPGDERIPEIRPANSEADKARNRRSGRKPMADFLVVLATP